MRTQIAGMVVMAALTGCQGLDGNMKWQSITESKESDQDSDLKPSAAPAISIQSARQKYLYTLINGVIQIRPIDADTGNLIEPQSGTWAFRPGSAEFNQVMLSPDKKYLYGLDLTAGNAKIWQYSFEDIGVYEQYQSAANLLKPLTPAYRVTSDFLSNMDFGDNGKFYQRNGNYLNEFSYNNGVITYVRNFLSLSSGDAALGLNFNNLSKNVTSITEGSHTYSVDPGNYRINHFVDGVFRDSTYMTHQATHMFIN